MEAWSASGGLPSSEMLVYEEELLVLAYRKAATGGMTVSGAGGASLDVLRWNGTCASLMEEEITTRVYGSPRHARVPWKNLDDAIQNAILGDEKILKVWSDRKTECKGATTSTDGNPRCEKADTKLNDLVVDHVRNGGAIPPPMKVP